MSTQRRKPGRPKGARRDPKERRDELLVAAERALEVHGPLVSMETIAEEAGVSKATIYDNFDGKRGLTDALLERWGDRVLTTMAAGLDRPLTPRQVMRGGIEVFVAVIEREIDLYRFVLAEHGSRTLLDESAGPVTTLVGSLLRQAGADPGGAEATARALLGGIFAAAEWWSEDRTMSRRQFVDHLDDLYWPGLAATGIGNITGPVDMTEIARLVAGGTPAAPTDGP
jgi:AcrR family transcriptional regulator